jgi:hypothetical protein
MDPGPGVQAVGGLFLCSHGGQFSSASGQFCAVQKLGNPALNIPLTKKPGNVAWYRNTRVVASSAKDPDRWPY